MKVGDIVQRKYGGWEAARTQGQTGIILKVFEKKCWRTKRLGDKINWDKIDPEPHAEIMINEEIITCPLAELEKVWVSVSENTL